MTCVCFRHKFTLGHSSTFEMTTCLAISVSAAFAKSSNPRRKHIVRHVHSSGDTLR